MSISLAIKLSADTSHCRGRDPIEILRCQLLLMTGLGAQQEVCEEVASLLTEDDTKSSATTRR
jgi:hypothetical protein